MHTIDETEYEHNGHTITIKWYHDEDHGTPWEEEDGHGPVSEWTRRDKQPGERVLCEDHGNVRYYDFAEAVKIAKRDGWDAKPYGTGTAKQRTTRAVEADFDHLRGWCNDAWHYAGYNVTIDGMEYHESLWGIDSPSMDQFEKDAIAEARAWLDNELNESTEAACRDVVTV